MNKYKAHISTWPLVISDISHYLENAILFMSLVYEMHVKAICPRLPKDMLIRRL